jgi:hypothetical protein
MAENSNQIKLVLKKKQISIVVDFCLEEAIEFSVKQQSFPNTDWEVDLWLKDVKAAILTGMFLRENHIEIEGADQQKLKKPSVKKTGEKLESTIKKEQPAKGHQETDESQEPTLM